MSAGQDIAFLSLAEDGAAAGDREARHVALVPGADVPLLALDLPPGLRGSAREEVARRQLRDRAGLRGDLTEMRPFFAPGGGEGWRRVLVADATRLADWRARAGPGCRAVLPDYLALPAAEGLWTIRVDNELVQVRMGLEDGFSAEPSLAQVMLTQALQAEEPPLPRMVLLQGTAPALAALFETRSIAVLSTPEEVAEAGIRPETLAHGELRFDLRADPRAARDRLRAQVLPWRWPVLVGLLAAMLWGTSQVLDTRALDAAAAVEREQTLAIVRDSFVPAGPVLDVRMQVARAMVARQDAARDWRGRVAPLTLFARVARVVDGSGAVSDSYIYDDDTLTAVLALADFATAEALVDDLRAVDLQVEVVDLRVSDSESGVRTELRVRTAR